MINPNTKEIINQDATKLLISGKMLVLIPTVNTVGYFPDFGAVNMLVIT
jgi:hypothetical protein